MSTIQQEAELEKSAEKKLPVEKPPVTKGRGRAFAIFFVILALVGIGATLFWLYSRQFETTDDAQVDAHMNSVSARIDGTVTHVYVEENQLVRVNDPLVDLDPRDFQVALDQALAQLAQSRSLVFAQRPNVPITRVQNSANISGGEADVANANAAISAAGHDLDSARAKLAQAQANSDKAQSDLTRDKILIAKEEISQQEYDSAESNAKAQAAAAAAAQASLESDTQIVKQRQAQLAQVESKLLQYRQSAPQEITARQAAVASEEAGVKTSQVQVEKAQLNLTYTKIVAPVAGIVMKRSAEVGAHVAAGQQLVIIAQIDDVWVTANFKETQLRNLRPQQPVTLHVDALKQDFEGYVEDIGGATGAVSSVLPPENATGNFVKVVQRIPVRLRFKKDQKGLDRLRPGMSVEPEVRIGG